MMDERKPTRYQLGLALDDALADLSEGYKGSSPTRLVREAVEEYIERCLNREPEVRKRYEIARKKRLEEKGTKLSVVKNGNDV